MINFASGKKIALIILLAAVFSISVNELNLRYIKKENPDNQIIHDFSTVYGYTVWNNDNSFYLPQIKNYIQYNDFTIDLINPEMRVRRTPVYPLFYAAHYLVFGEENSFFFIRYTQVLIHLLAVILLGQAIYNLTNNKFASQLGAVLYALNPFVVGYLYHTITESLSPALLVITFYSFTLCIIKFSFRNCINFGILMGIILLLRPSTLAFFPFALLGIFYQKKLTFENWSKYALIGLSLAFVLAPWTIRNYLVTGDFVPVEKYYFGDFMYYGRGATAFRSWTGSWNNPANVGAEIYSNAITKNIDNDQKISEIKNDFINKIPTYVFSVNSKEEVETSLDNLNSCYKEKQKVYKVNPNFTRKQAFETFTCEQSVQDTFNNLRGDFQQKSPFRYFVLTPILSVKDIAFSSNSYHFISLNPVDGNTGFVQKFLKAGCYILNLSLFLSLLLLPIFCREEKTIILVVIGTVSATFIMLIYWLRYMEIRYFIPLTPLMDISLSLVLTKIFSKLK